ncbi:SDR family NAD(P)-dependent oxidoreductase [Pseudomonas zhanjiangensis]|uniref:SDR family NAD(P)-dependent oxidoreductase n=1 Tax=Pseudomonas zhanjiangensis TaxID=3239015 RepID=A0ABV3YTS5_9PSED
MSRIYLISGCSSGIGRELALQLSAQGHTVFAGVRNPQSLASIASRSLIPLRLDVTDAGQIGAAFEQIRAHAGYLDGLINNAGYGAMGPLLEMQAAEVQAQFATNVFAPLALSRQLLPLLLEGAKPLIVNIGSSAGILATPFSGAYCASKAALHALSDVLRMELAPLGIQVMTVYPGAVASAFGDNAARRLGATLAADSRYRAIAAAIEQRAQISSESPTSPKAFARTLVAKLLAKAPPAEARIGHGSTLMPLAQRLLPLAWKDRLLRRRFQLDRLGPNGEVRHDH